jgi:FtsZ-binding cell division protein ZapB
MEELEALVDDLQERVSALEAENERLREENANLREQVEAKDEKNDALDARLRQYENPHTPPSKERSSHASDIDDTEDDVRTDGGTVGRNPGHDPAWRPQPDPDHDVEVPADTCPDCGTGLDEFVGVSPRCVKEIPEPDPVETTRYNLHHYDCECTDTTIQATHLECPA